MSNYQGESGVIDRGNNGNGGVKILSAEEQKLLEKAVKNGDRDKYIEILQIKIIEDPHEDLSGVLYPIGKEPENLKSRLDTLLAKIDAAYPFKIVFNLSKDHKKWGETLTDLYRKLGYPSGRALLRAYGYTIAEKIFSGNNDYNKFIDLLKQKYPDGSPFTSLSELQRDCTDLDIRWKSLQNNAPKVFGMGLKEYLCSIGILGDNAHVKSSSDWENIEKAFCELVENLREKYSDNIPRTYEQLIKENPGIEDKKILDYIRLKLCTTPARYFKEQGFIGTKDISTDEAKKYVDDIFAELNKKTIYSRPKSLSDLFAQNSDISEKIFRKYFEIAYPKCQLKDFLKERNLLRPNVDELYERIIVDLRLDYQQSGRKFVITEKAVKENFGISKREFYYIIFPGRECDYYRDTRNFNELGVYCELLDEFDRDELFGDVMSSLYQDIENGKSFTSVEDALSDFSEDVVSDFEFYIRLNKRCSVEAFLESAGIIADSRYFINVNLDSLQGKGCLVVVDYDDYRKRISSILKRHGASIKRTLSKNVEYVITWYSNIEQIKESEDDVLLQSLKRLEESGSPQFVLARQIDVKEDIRIFNQYKHESPQEKLQRAIALYDLCVSKINGMIEKDKTYNHAICSQDARIRGVLSKGRKFEDAYTFFDAVAKCNDTWGDDYTQTAEAYKEKYRVAHTPKDVNSSRFILGGCSLDGIVGVECPVALAVASFIYGSPENSVEIEFTRDKWEYRGDYCSSYFIAFELSKDYPEGRVFKSSQYSYSNM